MTEAIQSTTKLRCAIRCGGVPEAVVDGFTRVLARDRAVVDAGIDTPLGWLQHGRTVTLAIELPPFREQAPRVLECAATVGRSRPVDRYFRIDFEIHSMTIARLEDCSQSKGLEIS